MARTPAPGRACSSAALADLVVDHASPAGPTHIPVERYTSASWKAAEDERLWPHAWQLACSLDHVARPGDFYEYRAGWLSMLVVCGDDGELRAFQNVCRHRGNSICQGTGSGLDELRCPYHRWAWTTEGRLREVPSRKSFGRIDNDEYGLIPCQVDTWGPLVFVNLDLDAMPLREWLEGVPDDAASWAIDDYRCTVLTVTPSPANWKVVTEGFSETYHIQGIHPEMLRHVDDVNAPQKLWHRHGVSYQQYAVPSPRLGERASDEEVWDTWVESMGVRLGLDPSKDNPCPPVAPGRTIRDEIADRIIAHQASRGVDLSHYDSIRATSLAQYNLFPNATILLWSDMLNVLAARPGPTPDECEFVMLLFERCAPGAERTRPMTIDVPIDTDMGIVLNQDVAIMRTAQRGLHQPGLRHLTISADECRIANLHRNLEEWCC